MNRKPSFANLRTGTSRPVQPAPVERAMAKPGRAPSRAGRKQIAGFFPTEMSLALHMLALHQDRSLQSLMAEAFKDVLRKHGESPVGD